MPIKFLNTGDTAIAHLDSSQANIIDVGLLAVEFPALRVSGIIYGDVSNGKSAKAKKPFIGSTVPNNRGCAFAGYCAALTVTMS